MSDTATGVAETPVDERTQPEPDPNPANARKATTTPTRTYVVLQQGAWEDGEVYWTEVSRVDARNASTALRKAARDLHQRDRELTEVVLEVVPLTQWNPTTVTLSRNESIRVSIG